MHGWHVCWAFWLDGFNKLWAWQDQQILRCVFYQSGVQVVTYLWPCIVLMC